MRFEDLTLKQQERLKNCKSPEDILALAKAEGYELTQDELEKISVGGWGTLYECSQCGSNDIAVVHDPVNDNVYCTCRKCGHEWIAVEIH